MEEPITETPPVASNDGITESELKAIIGTELDSRFEALKPEFAKLDGLNLEQFKTDLLGEIGNLFTANKSAPLDYNDLIGKVDKLLATRLSSISGVTVKRNPGWLSRTLGFS